MKSLLKTIFLFSILSLSVACSKSKNTNLDNSLTGCPVNSTCAFSFQDEADFSAPNVVVAGEDRVFNYSSVNTNLCAANSQLYFKTPVSNGDFTIASNQIASGQALYYFSCPCCDYIGVKPIGGTIKGSRISATKWLINATVILGATQVGTFTDTLKFNQYFTAKTLVK